MIIHFKTVSEGDLLSLVAEHIVQKPEDVQKLLDIGAIYVEKKRVLQNLRLDAGTYVRVHLQPKKYFTSELSKGDPDDIVLLLKPKSWILAEEEDCYIVGKPHGLPAHPTLDNIQQNLLSLLRKSLDRELWLPHRLDVGTAGLIIVAKSQEAANSIQQDFIHHRIQKIYRALVEKPVDLGLYEHFMPKTKTSPKSVLSVADENTQNCLLKVTACVSMDSSAAEASQLSKNLYRLSLEPITGRTHQIRAQLAFLGAPIIGDKLYHSTAPFVCRDQKLFSQESFALEAYQILWRDKKYQIPYSTLD